MLEGNEYNSFREGLNQPLFATNEGRELVKFILLNPFKPLPPNLSKEEIDAGLLLQESLLSQDMERQRILRLMIAEYLLGIKDGNFKAWLKSQYKNDLAKIDKATWEVMLILIQSSTSLDMRDVKFKNLAKTDEGKNKILDICDAVKYSQLTSLTLPDTLVYVLDPRLFEEINASIMASNVKKLEWTFMEYEFDKEEEETLNVEPEKNQKTKDYGQSFKKDDLSDLEENVIEEAEEASKGKAEIKDTGTLNIETFSGGLKSSKLTHLDLNKIDILPLVSCVFDNIRESHVDSLKFASTYSLFDSEMEALNRLILKSNLTKLDLKIEKLVETKDQWPQFCEAIKLSNIKEFKIKSWDLFNLASKDWSAFCVALKLSKLSKLDLSGISFDLRNEGLPYWKSFFETMKDANLPELNLSKNFLHRLPKQPECWDALCDMVKNPNLKKLDLSENEFYELDERSWKSLCHALSSSKLTSLSMINEEYHLSFKYGHIPDFYLYRASTILEKALEDNFFIQELQTDFGAEQFEHILERNRVLNHACETAQGLLDSSAASLTENDISTAIIKLTSALSFLESKTTDNATAFREKLLDLRDELTWKKACMYMDKGYLQNALDIFESIPPESSYYQQAHFQAFNLVFSHALNDESRPVPRSRSAFIEALSCCLSVNGQLITFNPEQQSGLDKYLLVAAMGKDGKLGQNILFSPDQRNALLQYVLLQEIKELSERRAKEYSATNSMFSPARCQSYIGVIDLIEKSLPKIDNLTDINEHTQKEIDTLWNKAYAKLTTAPIEDESKKYLADAFHQHFEKSQQPRVHEFKNKK